MQGQRSHHTWHQRCVDYGEKEDLKYMDQKTSLEKILPNIKLGVEGLTFGQWLIKMELFPDQEYT